jgi:hypothetical protein
MSILQTPALSCTLHLDDLPDGTSIDADAVSLVRLREAVARRDWSPARGAAMRQLATSDFPNAHRDLERVLADDDELPLARHVAALTLARLATAGAAEVLLTHIGITLPAVRLAIVNGLGRIGDAAALPALARLHDDADEAGARQARFASMLIVHRLGVVGDQSNVRVDAAIVGRNAPLGRFQIGALGDATVGKPGRPTHADSRDECGTGLTPVPANAADAELCLRSLAHAMRGVEWLERPMLRMQCGNTRWLLAVNRAVSTADGVAGLGRRPMVVGVAARHDHRSGRYGATLAILSTPASTGTARIGVYALDGTAVSTGDARIDGDGAAFSVHPVAGPRPYAVTMEGRLSEDGLSFTRAVAVRAEKRQVVPVRRGSAVTAPA